MKAHYLAAMIATLLVGGAIILQITDLSVGPPAAQALVQSEFVHIPAHLVLYGALAAACSRVLGRRSWLVLLAVLAVGLAQEAAQSLLFGRAPGGGELFDLVVDASATLVVLGHMWLSKAA